MRAFIQPVIGQTANTERSLYDPEPTEVDDLWFLPGPDDEEGDDPTAPPLPRVNQRPLVDLDAWRNAEADLARPLAQLAARVGALDERLRCAPEGWKHRLALIEASALSWLGSERISVERLSLWQSQRLSGVQEDSQALACSGWALRRLSGGVIPRATSALEIAEFLGRHDPAGGLQLLGQGAAKHPEPVSDQLANWCEEMGRAQDLHPLTRAAFGFHLWGAVGMVDRFLGADMEAAVLAARLATTGLPGGMLFLPVSSGGIAGLRRSGSPQKRLERFLRGAESATLSALRHLDALEHWQARADTTLAQKSGRTPKQLITLLASWPLVSAPMAQAETGASRAAIQRNLNDMAQAELVREITGQGRYRVWAALV